MVDVFGVSGVGVIGDVTEAGLAFSDLPKRDLGVRKKEVVAGVGVVGVDVGALGDDGTRVDELSFLRKIFPKNFLALPPATGVVGPLSMEDVLLVGVWTLPLLFSDS